MISLILNKKNIPYFIIAVLIMYILMIGNKESIEIVIPLEENEIEIVQPEPFIKYDTIYRDSIQKKYIKKLVRVKNPVNKELLEKYEAAVKENDSLKQRKVFVEAVTKREYIEKLEDSIQTITVKASVTGTLDKLSIKYKTKPKIIKLKSKRNKPVVLLNGFFSLPTEERVFDLETYQIILPDSYRFGIQLQIIGKKMSYSVGYDNKKSIYLSTGIKLF